METRVLCLVGFALWAVVLVVAVGMWRSVLVLTGKVPSNGFNPGVQHGGDLYWRLNRAHVNALESLPVFASLVLAATLANVGVGSFDTACAVVLGARIAQTLVHVSGGSVHHVNVRFAFFLGQIGSFGWMAWTIVGAL